MDIEPVRSHLHEKGRVAEVVDALETRILNNG